MVTPLADRSHPLAFLPLRRARSGKRLNFFLGRRKGFGTSIIDKATLVLNRCAAPVHKDTQVRMLADCGRICAMLGARQARHEQRPTPAAGTLRRVPGQLTMPWPESHP